MHLAENIKYLREQDGLTQREFAEIVGDNTQSAVGNWEAGRREPELKMIIKIAEFFQVSLDDLILTELKPPVPLYVKNIKFLRKKHDMTQEDMAQLLGLRSHSGIVLVEKGERQLSVENLEKISDFFGVTMDQLVKRDLSKGAE